MNRAAGALVVLVSVTSVAACALEACGGGDTSGSLASPDAGVNEGGAGASPAGGGSGGSGGSGGGPIPDGLPDSGPLPETDAGPPPLSCTDDAGAACADDGNSIVDCDAGVAASTACPRGCLIGKGGNAPECLGSSWGWSCNGLSGSTRSRTGDYYLTAFGCWKEDGGTEHTDPGDNCIPSCLSEAIAAGVCKAGDTGKACEERVGWFSADRSRFGCLQHLRVTNPKNGNAAIVVVLDTGPNCSVESTASHAALDASGKLDRYLFGSDEGISDHALVHVVEVGSDVPLGPVP